MEILILLITILTSIIFFFIGRYTAVEDKDIKQIQKILKKREVGAFKGPTAEQVRKKGTILEETEQAMEETLTKIV